MLPNTSTINTLWCATTARPLSLLQSLEAMAQILRLEHRGGGEQFSCAQAELGIFAAAVCPLASTLAEQPRANADDRLDPELLRDRDDLPQFFEFLDHHDDFLA